MFSQLIPVSLFNTLFLWSRTTFAFDFVLRFNVWNRCLWYHLIRTIPAFLTFLCSSHLCKDLFIWSLAPSAFATTRRAVFKSVIRTRFFSPLSLLHPTLVIHLPLLFHACIFTHHLSIGPSAVTHRPFFPHCLLIFFKLVRIHVLSSLLASYFLLYAAYLIALHFKWSCPIPFFFSYFRTALIFFAHASKALRHTWALFPLPPVLSQFESLLYLSGFFVLPLSCRTLSFFALLWLFSRFLVLSFFFSPVPYLPLSLNKLVFFFLVFSFRPFLYLTVVTSPVFPPVDASPFPAALRQAHLWHVFSVTLVFASLFVFFTDLLSFSSTSSSIYEVVVADPCSPIHSGQVLRSMGWFLFVWTSSFYTCLLPHLCIMLLLFPPSPFFFATLLGLSTPPPFLVRSFGKRDLFHTPSSPPKFFLCLLLDFSSIPSP